jgi:hypothetical protein
MAIAAGRTHTYYAEAHALAKQSKGSYGDNVAVYGQIFLDPEKGGELCCEPGPLNVEGGFCINSSCMQVSGALTADGWVTTASSVLEGVDVRGVLTADRIEGRIVSVHPPMGYMPTVQFQEVKYTNLKLNRLPLTPQVDKAILGKKPDDAAGKDPNSDPYLDEWLTSEEFLTNVKIKMHGSRTIRTRQRLHARDSNASLASAPTWSAHW